METRLPNNLHFNVSVLDQFQGQKLKVPKLNDYGYYEMPIALLGAPSRNRAFYDIESIVQQINDPNTVFNMMLTQGNLYGEHGHPSSDVSLERLVEVSEDRRSHHIRRVWTGKATDRGVILFAEIRPTGVYGKYLEESILNPYENTTFSLRSLMVPDPNKSTREYEYRIVKRLVTFDYVTMPGYAEASKWYVGHEDFSRPITVEEIYKQEQLRVAGLENFSSEEMCKLFDLKHAQVNGCTLENYIPGTTNYLSEGRKKSIVHAFLKQN